jgi:hypothetical protein
VRCSSVINILIPLRIVPPSSSVPSDIPYPLPLPLTSPLFHHRFYPFLPKILEKITFILLLHVTFLH